MVHPIGRRTGELIAARCGVSTRVRGVATADAARHYQRMKPVAVFALWFGWVLVTQGMAISEVLKQTDQLEAQGRFQAASRLLGEALAAPALAPADRKRLEFELDRLERIRRDFPHTREALFAALQQAVAGLTREEFDRWVAEGRFDSRSFDGELRFMSASVSNLFFRYPELNGRRIGWQPDPEHERHVYERCAAILQAARAQRTPYVLPKTVRVHMNVAARADAVPAGATVRAWLPIPRAFPFQRDFHLHAASPTPRAIAPENSPIRSIYFEQEARAGQPTEFRIEYTYTAYGVYFELQPRTVRAPNANDPALQPFLREAPHVQFTPEMRALSRQIAGRETHPLRLARKFYDWIGENIRYSYAIEYSTIRNIGEYCRARGYGDCGQEALLFITLCRLNGIPARWQSGWNLTPGQTTMHDWCEIYLAPHGWVPVDPYMSIYATRYIHTLTRAQRHLIRDFYFGGLDQYRMAANSDHSQELTPPKESFRSDDVDFQRGELEANGRNLYFDAFTYQLRATVEP